MKIQVFVFIFWEGRLDSNTGVIKMMAGSILSHFVARNREKVVYLGMLIQEPLSTVEVKK